MMGSHMKMCGPTFSRAPVILASVFTASLFSPVKAADIIEIASGQQKTFGLTFSGETLRPVHIRSSPIGHGNAREGKMTIGLAPAGHAVQMAKLHTFEQLKTAVNFQVVAFHGSTAVATEEFCGRLDMDAWAALPAATSRVEISRFVEAKAECP